MENRIALSADYDVCRIYGKWRNRRMDLQRKMDKRDNMNDEKPEESELGA